MILYSSLYKTPAFSNGGVLLRLSGFPLVYIVFATVHLLWVWGY